MFFDGARVVQEPRILIGRTQPSESSSFRRGFILTLNTIDFIIQIIIVEFIFSLSISIIHGIFMVKYIEA